MIIECSACNSRFRLDESKITGRGARVRCRKCGEPITVMKENVDDAGATAPAEPAEQPQGLDLRSILRESLDAPAAPAQPAPEPAEVEALQSDFEKMMADAEKEAEAEMAAPPAAEPASPDGGAPRRPGTDERPEVDGSAGTATPTEERAPQAQVVQEQPTPAEPRAPQAQAAQERPPADAPAPSSEFMMSTADSLDFLKADYSPEEQKAPLDISGNLRIAPAPGAREGTVAAPLGTQHSAAPAPPAEPPSRSESIRSELAGLGRTAAADSAGAAPAAKTPAAASSRAKVAAPPPPREEAAPRPSSPVRRTPPRKAAPLKRGQGSQLVRPSVILLLLLFFVLAGGGAYLGFTSGGQTILRSLVPQIESLWMGAGPPASRYEVGDLTGYYETNATAGKMFIIKGQVTNEGQQRKTGVRVHAILLDAGNKTVGEKTVYAGNVFAGDALRQATRQKIEAAMSNPIGGGLANIDIPPGKAVPFMVVFFDAPDGIDSYRLEPKDVD